MEIEDGHRRSELRASFDHTDGPLATDIEEISIEGTMHGVKLHSGAC
jgi:hypothetical protein